MIRERLFLPFFLVVNFFSLSLFPKEHSSHAQNLRFSNSAPSFQRPTSQLATAKQFRTQDFIRWTNELKETYRYHRKLWEFCFVAQVLETHGFLREGKTGIGFGVGTESLPALFANYGCHIIASDQDFAEAYKQGWTQTEQYALCKSSLNAKGICSPEIFDQRVDLRCIDMNNIDAQYDNTADFIWSCCCFEHLGSIKNGLAFVMKSLRCLKPGGIAVHTTEFNISSRFHTISRGGTVLFRKCDIKKLARKISAMGYKVARLNFNPGCEKLDFFVDVPPYSSDNHLKLQIAKYTTTSIGLIIQKPFNHTK